MSLIPTKGPIPLDEPVEAIVCGIGYRLQRVEGGALFSELDACAGMATGVMFELDPTGLWYLSEATRAVPVRHLAVMSRMLDRIK